MPTEPTTPDTEPVEAEPAPDHPEDLDPNLVRRLQTLVGNYGARGVVLAVEVIEPGAILGAVHGGAVGEWPAAPVAVGEWPARTVTDAELPARLQAAVADHQALEAVLDWAEVVHDPGEAAVIASNPEQLAERLLEELDRHGWILTREDALKGRPQDRPKPDAEQRREAVSTCQFLANELRLTSPALLLAAADEVADYLAAGPKPSAATEASE